MLPEKIIVFRDGVGDGDMKMITDFEVPQFFEGFSMFGKKIVLCRYSSDDACVGAQGLTTSQSSQWW